MARDTIDDLLAAHAIQRQLHRYCRGVDRRDPALLKDVFWPDAQVRYGLYDGPAHAFVDWLMAHFSAAGMGVTIHSTGNALVERVGDEAVVESQYRAEHKLTVAGADRAIVLRGRYHDTFVRRADAWRIAFRRPILDAFSDDPAPGWDAQPLGLDPAVAVIGRPGPDDDWVDPAFGFDAG